jgi:enterochelin esterase-like enzyme
MCRILRITLILLLCCTSGHAAAQVAGVVEDHEVYGASLENNVTGERTRRPVAVYLPPGYAEDSARRYPVLYLLHGIGGTHEDWTRPGVRGQTWQSIQDVMDRGIAANRLAELIVVAADQRTRGGGSFYVNSEVTGNWEEFTVVDLVEYADTTYRTLARAASRGIAGHSMGGFGALRIGMRYPEIYQVVYGLNSAILGFDSDISAEQPAYARAANVEPDELDPLRDFYTASLLCVAQALSPNPANAPFFADLPFASVDGRLAPTPAYHRWEEQMPLHMVEEYRDNLLALRGLRFDSGRYDMFSHIAPTNLALSEKLTELGVPHVFEDYNGDHNDRLWGAEGRMATEVLPYFSRLLEGE